MTTRLDAIKNCLTAVINSTVEGPSEVRSFQPTLATNNKSQSRDLQRWKVNNNTRLDDIETRLTTVISRNTREVIELRGLLEEAMAREQGHELTKVDLENALKPVSAQLQEVSDAGRSSEAATEISERRMANIIKWRDELARHGNESTAVENLLSVLLAGQDDLKDSLSKLEPRSSQVKRLSVHTLADPSTRPQHRRNLSAASIDRLRHSPSTDTLSRGVGIPGH